MIIKEYVQKYQEYKAGLEKELKISHSILYRSEIWKFKKLEKKVKFILLSQITLFSNYFFKKKINLNKISLIVLSKNQDQKHWILLPKD